MGASVVTKIKSFNQQLYILIQRLFLFCILPKGTLNRLFWVFPHEAPTLTTSQVQTISSLNRYRFSWNVFLVWVESKGTISFHSFLHFAYHSWSCFSRNFWNFEISFCYMGCSSLIKIKSPDTPSWRSVQLKSTGTTIPLPFKKVELL